MQIISTGQAADKAAKYLSELITDKLATYKVLLLLAGGSANDVYKLVPEYLSGTDLSGLTVIMGDERWNAEPQHNDSDWKHFQQTAFYGLLKQKGALTVNILHGKALEAETAEYAEFLEQALANKYYVIAQLGVGADGHTAGIIPAPLQQFLEVFDTEALAVAHHLDPKHRDRITISLAMLDRINDFVLYGVGEAKRSVIHKIQQNLQSDTKDIMADLHNTPVLYVCSKSAKLFTDLKLV
jgi:6-phosphogluconolactonase/glucosamine-6-phosphate isomerase/deaminase